MLEIRKATTEDYKCVRQFYHKMIDDMQSMTYRPGWQKEVYPSDAMLREALERGELYVGELEEKQPSHCIGGELEEKQPSYCIGGELEEKQSSHGTGSIISVVR